MHPRTLNTANRAANFLGYFSLGLGALEAAAPGALGRTLGLERHTTLLRLYGVRELTAGAAILTQTTTPQWMWARVAGDAVDIATLALALGPQNTKRGNAAAALAAVVGITALDIWTAYQLTRQANDARQPLALRSPESAT